MSEIVINELSQPSSSVIEANVKTSGIVSSYIQQERLRVSYTSNISSVPDEIGVIPFIGSMAPVAWVTESDLKVPVIDPVLEQNLSKVRDAFAKMSSTDFRTDKKPIYAANTAKPLQQTQNYRNAILFTGGVDSTATYLRKRENETLLLSIKDGRLPEAKWNKRQEYVSRITGETANNVEYIECEENEWINYGKLSLFYPDDFGRSFWSAGVYGLAYIALSVPIVYLNGISDIYQGYDFIHADEEFPQNHPYLVEPFRWSGMRTHIDGENLSRQDKINYICNEESHDWIEIFSCTNSGHENCSYCQKCYRTMFGIAASGNNPSDYGFKFGPKTLIEFRNMIEGGHFSLKYPHKPLVWADIQNHIGQETFPLDECEDWLDWFKSIKFEKYYTAPQRSWKKDFLARLPESLGHRAYQIYKSIR